MKLGYRASLASTNKQTLALVSVFVQIDSPEGLWDQAQPHASASVKNASSVDRTSRKRT